MGSIAPLLIGLLSADVQSTATRVKRLSLFYGLAGILALFAFGSLVVALGIVMARSMRPEIAALALSGILLSVSFLLLAIASVWSSRQRKIKARRSVMPTLAATAAVTLLPALLSNRIGFGVLSAAIAGYAYANRNPRRSVRSTDNSSKKFNT